MPAEMSMTRQSASLLINVHAQQRIAVESGQGSLLCLVAQRTQCRRYTLADPVSIVLYDLNARRWSGDRDISRYKNILEFADGGPRVLDLRSGSGVLSAVGMRRSLFRFAVLCWRR